VHLGSSHTYQPKMSSPRTASLRQPTRYRTGRQPRRRWTAPNTTVGANAGSREGVRLLSVAWRTSRPKSPRRSRARLRRGCRVRRHRGCRVRRYRRGRALPRPSDSPTLRPSARPSGSPSEAPTPPPSVGPSKSPSLGSSSSPTAGPSRGPSPLCPSSIASNTAAYCVDHYDA
jgi:hypothetical protein